MIFEHATPQEIQAAQIVTAATMVGMLSARLFGRHARTVRLAIAAVYFAAVIAFVIYYLL